jgi:hypothetical protein
MSSATLPVTTVDQPRPCKLVEWKPWPNENSSLIAHVSVSFSGWKVNKIPVFRGADGSLSVGAPDIPEIDASGRVRMTEDGKRKYQPLIQFETNEARERWRRAIQGAIVAAGFGGAP